MDRSCRPASRCDAASLAGPVPRPQEVGGQARLRAAGLLILALVLAATFALVSIVGAAAASFLSGAWAAFASPVIDGAVRTVVPVPQLASGLLWGLDSGILGLLAIGIPYVLLFYLLIAVLEDSGYLTSLAVLTDRLLGGLGLSGRTAIPLLAATACTVAPEPRMAIG